MKKALLAALTLIALSAPALATPMRAEKSSVDGLFTQAQFRMEVEGDRDRRDGFRRDERMRIEQREGWREGRAEWRGRERCTVTIVRRFDGTIRRIKRCRW